MIPKLWCFHIHNHCGHKKFNWTQAKLAGERIGVDLNNKQIVPFYKEIP